MGREYTYCRCAKPEHSVYHYYPEQGNNVWEGNKLNHGLDTEDSFSLNQIYNDNIYSNTEYYEPDVEFKRIDRQQRYSMFLSIAALGLATYCMLVNTN
jgi:hypothetical protein